MLSAQKSIAKKLTNEFSAFVKSHKSAGLFYASVNTQILLVITQTCIDESNDKFYFYQKRFIYEKKEFNKFLE